MPDHAEQLITEVKASPVWPLHRDRQIVAAVALRAAFRRADAINHRLDREIIKQFARWEQRSRELFVGEAQREYIIDPLPRRIASAFADFLWGAEPTITAAAEEDQTWLGLLIEENRLPSLLHRAEMTLVSEGEAWWKAWVDRDCAVTPLIDFVSRGCVTPLWRGDRLLACAFTSEVCVEGGYGYGLSGSFGALDYGSWGAWGGGVVWRHLEVHADGQVRNLLFKGTQGQLGTEQPLTARPETEDLTPVWNHGLPMLAGRLVNDTDDDHTLGISDFDPITDFFLMLNEARAISAENTRLTAKKRLFVHGSLTSGAGEFDAGNDVIIVESNGGMLGEDGGKPPVTEVQYSYDAEALIKHMSDVETSALTRVGLVPKLVGREDAHPQSRGQMSGVAIRLQYLPTENAASGKAREWDDKLPNILQLLMMVDSLPAERGGFGRSYRNLLAVPTVERGDILPRDDNEIVTENAAAVSAGIRSRYEAVKAQHDTWTERDIEDELERIAGDEQSMRAIDEPPDPPDAPSDPAAPPPAVDNATT